MNENNNNSNEPVWMRKVKEARIVCETQEEQQRQLYAQQQQQQTMQPTKTDTKIKASTASSPFLHLLPLAQYVIKLTQENIVQHMVHL